MPFDWSEKSISQIPIIHEEVHFPKDFDSKKIEERGSKIYNGLISE